MATSRASGGSSDVFVQPFPPTGAKYQVFSGTGGRTPAWSPDGKRLLVVLPAETAKTGAARDASPQIYVVLNWFEELRRRAPAK